MLRLEESALERIIDQGFDPVMGARALKRGIERQLTQPVAARLAAGVPETITAVNVYPRGNGVAVDVQGLTEVSRLPDDHRRLGDPETVRVRRCRRRLRRDRTAIRALAAGGRDHGGEFGGRARLLFHDPGAGARRLRRAVAASYLDVLEESRRPAQASFRLRRRCGTRPGHCSGAGLDDNPPYRNVLGEMAAAADIQLYLEELAGQAGRAGRGDRHEACLAGSGGGRRQLAGGAGGCERDKPAGEQVLLYLWTANPAEW